MKKITLLPARQVFQSPAEKKEGERKAPQTNPFADALEANADKKPPLDVSKKVPGYPNDTLEVTDTKSETYKKAIAELLPKMTDQLKKRFNRAPRHGDALGGQIDEKSTILVIDENASPKERIFVAKEKTEKGGQKTSAAEIPADVVAAKTKGYPEVKNAPADVVRRAKDTFKSQQGRDMAHEETATAFDSKDYEYVVMRDDHQKKFRVFKSPEPVPA